MDVRRGFVAAVLIVAAACSSSGSEPTTGPSDSADSSVSADAVLRDVDVAGLETDIFGPATGVAGAGELPIAVMLHGTLGDRTRMEPLAASVADTGVLVYVPTWPVIDQVAPYPEAEGDEPFRRQSEAVICLLREVKRTAAELGGDPDDLTVIGHSGGGMIGARVAIVADPPWPGIDCDPGIDHRPNRFIGLAGDYLGIYQYGLQESRLYAPYDVLALEPTDDDLEVWLLSGQNDDTVNVSSAALFADHLAAAGIEAQFLTTDTTHAAPLDPSAPAGKFTSERIAAVLGGTAEPEWWPGPEPDATLRLDADDTCVHDGPESWPNDRTMTIQLENRTGVDASFALVSVRSGLDITRDEALAGGGILGVDNPDWVDWGGFRPVPPGETRTLHFAFVEADQDFVVYCHLEGDTNHPMAGWMFPTALLVPEITTDTTNP
jgi:acetyl esterase/lipase